MLEGGVGWWFDVGVFHATDIPLRKIADRLPNRDSPPVAAATKKIGKMGDDFTVTTFGGPGQGLYVVLSESYFCSDAIPKGGLHQDYDWKDAAALKTLGKPTKLHIIVSDGERHTKGKCGECLATRPSYKLFVSKDTEELVCSKCRKT